MIRVTIFDYGAGNLHSLAKAVAGPGRTLRIERDPTLALETDLLVLPGVGAFAAAARALSPGRVAMRDAIAAGLPTLGICLGMQLLFDASDEGEGAGLGVITGRVTALAAQRAPQMGWNRVEDRRDPAFDTAGLQTAYYANGFACRPEALSTVTAWSTHEADRFPAAVRVARCVGVQFHPEKSSAPGVRFLDAVVSSLTSSPRPAPSPLP